MAWYWWILIVVGVVALGALKMVAFKKLLRKKQADAKRQEEED